MKDEFIVKVQLSLYTNEKKQRVLIYNKDRSVTYEGNVRRKIAKVMGRNFKKYFNATIKGKHIILLDEVGEQKW